LSGSYSKGLKFIAWKSSILFVNKFSTVYYKAVNCDWHRKNDPDHNPKAEVAWKDPDAGKAWEKVGKPRFDSKARRPLADSLYPNWKRCKSCVASLCLECSTCLCNNNTPAIVPSLNGQELPSSIIEKELSNKFSSNEIDTNQYLSAFNSDQDYTLLVTVLCKSNDVSNRFLLYVSALHRNYISVDLAATLDK